MHDLFEAFGINWKLLIAQAVNFGIVLVALTYFLYKPVMKTLDERRKVVAKGVEDADVAAKKLEAADGEALSRVQNADKEAGEIVTAARSAANDEKTKIINDAEARAVAIASEARSRAIETAARAQRESEAEIARLAILASEKILKRKYD